MLLKINRILLSSPLHRYHLNHRSHLLQSALSMDSKRNVHLLLSKTFINGDWVSGAKKEELTVYNPASGKVVGNVPDLNVKDAEEAVNAAYQAFYSPGWSTLTAKDRSGLLKVIIQIQLRTTRAKISMKINLFYECLLLFKEMVSIAGKKSSRNCGYNDSRIWKTAYRITGRNNIW